MGRGVGCCRVAQRPWLARRVQDSVLTASIPPVGDVNLWSGDHPQGRPLERDGDVAALVEEFERLRVLVRRADRSAADKFTETPRGRSLHGRRRDDTTGRAW